MGDDGQLTDVTDRFSGYGLDFEGFGLKCPECGHEGTYYRCAKCGYLIEDVDVSEMTDTQEKRLYGPDGKRSVDTDTERGDPP